MPARDPAEQEVETFIARFTPEIAGRTRACRAALRARGGGVLINVASVIGKISAPFYASFAAAKFGVVGLGHALRQE